MDKLNSKKRMNIMNDEYSDVSDEDIDGVMTPNYNLINKKKQLPTKSKYLAKQQMMSFGGFKCKLSS